DRGARRVDRRVGGGARPDRTHLDVRRRADVRVGREALMDSDHPLLGQVLDGRYQILSHLARGGMSDVFLAEQQSLGRVVALKVLQPPNREFTLDEFRQRFLLEAQLASRLVQANTVRIYDFGRTESGIFYIAMEYVPGPTLAQVLREGPLAPTRAIS